MNYSLNFWDYVKLCFIFIFPMFLENIIISLAKYDMNYKILLSL